MRIYIFGLGEIGRELENKYANIHDVTGFTTNRNKYNENPTNRELIDYTNLCFKEVPDRVYICAGVLHNERLKPEKSLEEFSANNFEEYLEANVYPTIAVCKQLSRITPRTHKIQIITFSARVGSISDNKKGGWYGYRMSKAVLNMFIKNMAIEWKNRSKALSIIGYHPGTVDTNLSKKYSKNVQHEIFSTKTAVEHLEIVLKKDLISGKIYDWKGLEILP